jgi:histidyl-tRNA synthetase
MERAELYESKTSEEIVNEQTYTFEDRGGRRVTLRPEMTPTLARMVAGKRRELTFPLRWFSIGNRFRYERPQRGRLREFYQMDVDFVGLPAGEADIEAITLATTILKDFGAKDTDFIVRACSRKLLTQACVAAGLSEEGTKQYVRLLDKKSKMPDGEFKAAASALAPKDPLALIEEGDPSIIEEKERTLGIIDELKKRGVSNVVFDPTLVRGFDYYTGIVFEVFDTDPTNPRSVFGGGRYDGLVSLFGGDPIPAVGFAIGDVTLADFLETHKLLPDAGSVPQLYIGTPEADDIKAAQQFALRLREEGVRVFVNLTEKALGDQVRDAVRRAIPFFVAWGKTEAESGKARLKALATGNETEVEAADIPRAVAS